MGYPNVRANKTLLFLPPTPETEFGFPAGRGVFTKLEYLILNHDAIRVNLTFGEQSPGFRFLFCPPWGSFERSYRVCIAGLKY
jgi:hypothetical protein